MGNFSGSWPAREGNSKRRRTGRETSARPVDVESGGEILMEGRFEVETAAVATFEHSFNSMTSSCDYSFHYRRCIQIVTILYTDGAGLFAIFAVQKKFFRAWPFQRQQEKTRYGDVPYRAVPGGFFSEFRLPGVALRAFERGEFPRIAGKFDFVQIQPRHMPRDERHIPSDRSGYAGETQIG